MKAQSKPQRRAKQGPEAHWGIVSAATAGSSKVFFQTLFFSISASLSDY